MSTLIIFYDSHCPLCCFEMDKLVQHDVTKQIKLVDIYSDQFAKLAPNIPQTEALSTIHGIYQNQIIKGIDVNYWAWTLVGKQHWVILLKVPITRQLAKLGYRIFARFRHQISSTFSKLFKRKAKQCSYGYCHDHKKTSDHRR